MHRVMDDLAEARGFVGSFIGAVIYGMLSARPSTVLTSSTPRD